MKNKKVIIISIIALIILVALSIVALYFTTDLFKSNKELFFKYIAKTEIINSKYIKTCSDALKKVEKSNSSSNMDISISTININQENSISNTNGLINIKSNGLKNVNASQYYNDFTIFSNNEELLTLKLLRDNNLYGFGADTILKKYISVENSNLKEFFTKLGASNIESIPDSIPDNYDELFKIDETTFNTIKEKYILLIYNNMDNTNFNVTRNTDKTKTFTLSLTEQQTVNIIKTILNTAKNDTTILNLITSKAQLLGYKDVNNEEVQKQIQNSIDNLSKNTYSNENGYITLSFLKADKTIKEIKLQCKYKDEIVENEYNVSNEISTDMKEHKYEADIDISKQGEVNVSVKDNDTQISKLSFIYSYDDNILKSEINIENPNNISIKLNSEINNYQTDNIIEKTNIVYTYNSNNVQIDISNNINLKQDVQIEKLTTENSAILNDMTEEELNSLFTAIANRIMSLYGPKVNDLSI